MYVVSSSVLYLAFVAFTLHISTIFNMHFEKNSRITTAGDINVSPGVISAPTGCLWLTKVPH